MKEMTRILVILTGGTICSLSGRSGKNKSAAKKTESYLADNYRASNSPFANLAAFDYRSLDTDVLSENMTAAVLYELLGIFKSEENIERTYAGVILLHGTDTLAYTSSFLSFALAGLSLPVCMVSAQLALKRKRRIEEDGRTKVITEDEPNTNGYANFRAATELILNGIAPNVYAVYRNMDGKLLVHLGSHLLQCPNGSDDFHSRDEMTVPDPQNAALAGVRFESDRAYYRQVKKEACEVLLLHPHTNLNYAALDLRAYRAVIHGTYHSESVCIGRPSADQHAKQKEYYTLDMLKEEDRPYSMLALLSACKERGIPLFLAPCDKKSFKYGTTANALKCGAIPLSCITLESAYAKALLGCMLGKRGKSLTLFMKKSIDLEFAPSSLEG